MSQYPPPVSSPPWTDQTKRTVGLILLLLLGLAVVRLNAIIPLISIAVILSFLLNPLANVIERRILVYGPLKGRAMRPLAVVLTFVVAAQVITLALLIIVPVLISQFNELSQSIPGIVEDAETTLEEKLSEPITFRGEPILINGEPVILLDRLRESLGGETAEGDILQLENLDLLGAAQSFVGSLTGVTGTAFGFVGGAFSVIINGTFLFMMMFYLMNDGPQFVAKLIEATPPNYRDDVRRLLYELAHVWASYLRGQLILSLVMGTVVFIAATILGVPNAPILGLLAGLFEFIPNIGPLLALIPAALLALFSKSSTFAELDGVIFALVVVVVWTGLQQVESLILVPRIIGDSLNLHPFVVIVAVIGGASFAGAIGVILAAPTVASGRVFGRYFYGKMLDQDMFPAVEPGASRVETGRAAVRRFWEAANEWFEERPAAEAVETSEASEPAEPVAE